LARGCRRQRGPGQGGVSRGRAWAPVAGVHKPGRDPGPARGPRQRWRGTPYLADAALGPDITIDRLDTRRTLLQQIDDQQRRFESRAAADAFDRTRRRAFGLLTASKLKAAFNLDLEDRRVRDRYANNVLASSALIARRLI